MFFLGVFDRRIFLTADWMLLRKTLFPVLVKWTPSGGYRMFLSQQGTFNHHITKATNSLPHDRIDYFSVFNDSPEASIPPHLSLIDAGTCSNHLGETLRGAASSLSVLQKLAPLQVWVPDYYYQYGPPKCPGIPVWRPLHKNKEGPHSKACLLFQTTGIETKVSPKHLKCFLFSSSEVTRPEDPDVG